MDSREQPKRWIDKDPETQRWKREAVAEAKRILGDPYATSEFQPIPQGFENILKNKIMVALLSVFAGFVMETYLVLEDKGGIAARKQRVTNALAWFDVIELAHRLIWEERQFGIADELVGYWNGNVQDARESFDDLMRYWQAVILLLPDLQLHTFTPIQVDLMVESTKVMGTIDIQAEASQRFPNSNPNGFGMSLLALHYLLKHSQYIPLVDLPNYKELYNLLVAKVEADPALQTQT